MAVLMAQIEALEKITGAEVKKVGSNLRFARWKNHALDMTDSELVALLNPDAFPESDGLKKIMDAAQNHPYAAAFGSRCLPLHIAMIIAAIVWFASKGRGRCCSQYRLCSITGDVVLFLNPDCQLEKGAVAELYEVLMVDRCGGMVGGLLVNPDGGEQDGVRFRIRGVHLCGLLACIGLAVAGSSCFMIITSTSNRPLPDRPASAL